MRLGGKTALVTGADSGIGRAIAMTFAREGADVVVHYHTDRRGAEQTSEAIASHGRRTAILEADFTDPAAGQSLIVQVVSQLGRLDILVNNAGRGSDASSSLEIATDVFLDVLHVDLVVPFILARDAARVMVDQGGGAIINVTSVHEEIPSPGGADYAAAKGGLRMVTRTLALELAPHGIRVNNLAPGMIATPMTASTLQDADASAEAIAKIPLGRPGEPQEMANVALFLASDEASYVTGSTFFADGGLCQRVGLA